MNINSVHVSDFIDHESAKKASEKVVCWSRLLQIIA